MKPEAGNREICATGYERRRRSIAQPRVARTRYPGSPAGERSTLKGFHQGHPSNVQPLQGWGPSARVPRVAPGRNPGLRARTPMAFHAIPLLARAVSLVRNGLPLRDHARRFTTTTRERT